MSAILNHPGTLDTNRDSNNAGCFVGAFFLNQYPNETGGETPGMRLIMLEYLRTHASSSTVTLSDIVWMLRDHADRSRLSVLGADNSEYRWYTQGVVIAGTDDELLIEIDRRANSATIPLDAIVAIVKNHTDKSTVAV